MDFELENIEYDDDCQPFTKDDILTGKIVKSENIIALTEDNYNWLMQFTKKQSISENVNLIVNYFRQTNLQLQNA